MRNRFLVLCTAIAILLLGLLEMTMAANRQTTTGTDTTADTSFFTATFNIADLSYDSSYDPGVRTGELADTNLHEASGMAAARRYPGCWWMHNDGGNPNDIFLTDGQGKELAVVTLEGYTNRDWEDIAIGGGPQKGVSYIYIAETGDNHLQYGSYCIYRIPEPKLKLQRGKTVYAVAKADKISFVYPDGPHNAEALLLDPLTKDLYIVTKSKTKAEAIVYAAAWPQTIHQTIVLKKVGILPIMKVTAGAISPDGHEIVIKNLDHIFYWKRPAGTSVAAALAEKPALLPYAPEPQGEAIDWSVDGRALYTTSEKKGPATQVIYKYTRK